MTEEQEAFDRRIAEIGAKLDAHKRAQEARLATPTSAAVEDDWWVQKRFRDAKLRREARQNMIGLWVLIVVVVIALLYVFTPSQIWWGYRKARCEIYSDRFDCLTIDQEQHE